MIKLIKKLEKNEIINSEINKKNNVCEKKEFS